MTVWRVYKRTIRCKSMVEFRDISDMLDDYIDRIPDERYDFDEDFERE